MTTLHPTVVPPEGGPYLVTTPDRRTPMGLYTSRPCALLYAEGIAGCTYDAANDRWIDEESDDDSSGKTLTDEERGVVDPVFRELTGQELDEHMGHYASRGFDRCLYALLAGFSVVYVGVISDWTYWELFTL